MIDEAAINRVLIRIPREQKNDYQSRYSFIDRKDTQSQKNPVISGNEMSLRVGLAQSRVVKLYEN